MTDWRQRRAVLHAYSSGMENHLGAVERRSLEAAGFPGFAPEEDFYPKVNVMQVEVPDDDGAEGQEMNWDVVEPIPEESHHGVNASFVELRLAVQQPGNPGVNGHVQWEAGTVQNQGASMFKAEVGYTRGIEALLEALQSPLAIVHTVHPFEVEENFGKWKAVILEEISAIEHATVPLPEGSSVRKEWLDNDKCQVLPMKLVYTVKPPQLDESKPEMEKFKQKAHCSLWEHGGGRLVRSLCGNGSDGGGEGNPHTSCS